MSWTHTLGKKLREAPIEHSPYFSGVPIFRDLLRQKDRDPKKSPWQPQNTNLIDHNIHPGEPAFEWVEYPQLGVWTDFVHLKIPEKYQRELNNMYPTGPTAQQLQEFIKERIQLVGFASLETDRNAYGNHQDMTSQAKVTLIISQPVSVIITEPEGVKDKDWLTFEVPDPGYGCNRFRGTFRKVDKRHPQAHALKNLVAEKNIKFEGQGLANVV